MSRPEAPADARSSGAPTSGASRWGFDTERVGSFLGAAAGRGQRLLRSAVRSASSVVGSTERWRRDWDLDLAWVTGHVVAAAPPSRSSALAGPNYNPVRELAAFLNGEGCTPVKPQTRVLAMDLCSGGERGEALIAAGLRCGEVANFAFGAEITPTPPLQLLCSCVLACSARDGPSGPPLVVVWCEGAHRGRSMLVIVCHVVHQGLHSTPEAALAFVKEKCGEAVKLTPGQMRYARLFASRLTRSPERALKMPPPAPLVITKVEFTGFPIRTAIALDLRFDIAHSRAVYADGQTASKQGKALLVGAYTTASSGIISVQRRELLRQQEGAGKQESTVRVTVDCADTPVCDDFILSLHGTNAFLRTQMLFTLPLHTTLISEHLGDAEDGVISYSEADLDCGSKDVAGLCVRLSVRRAPGAMPEPVYSLDGSFVVVDYAAGSGGQRANWRSAPQVCPPPDGARQGPPRQQQHHSGLVEEVGRGADWLLGRASTAGAAAAERTAQAAREAAGAATQLQDWLAESFLRRPSAAGARAPTSQSAPASGLHRGGAVPGGAAPAAGRFTAGSAAAPGSPGGGSREPQEGSMMSALQRVCRESPGGTGPDLSPSQSFVDHIIPEDLADPGPAPCDSAPRKADPPRRSTTRQHPEAPPAGPPSARRRPSSGTGSPPPRGSSSDAAPYSPSTILSMASKPSKLASSPPSDAAASPAASEGGTHASPRPKAGSGDEKSPSPPSRPPAAAAAAAAPPPPPPPPPRMVQSGYTVVSQSAELMQSCVTGSGFVDTGLSMPRVDDDLESCEGGSDGDR